MGDGGAGSFGARLRTVVDACGQLVVGIDPHATLLSAWGLPDDAGGVESFAMTVLDALADRVAVFKPQSAFFERHGSAGIAVLERVLGAIREAGAMALLDAKRGDIGSTMAAYAEAYLHRGSPLFADAITVHPYLGFGSLRPVLTMATENGAGVFVLAMTSNPEASEVQSARRDGRPVAGVIADHIAKENAGASPLGSVGAVVGATTGSGGAELFADAAGLAMNGPVLVPGLGAQGARMADVRAIFGSAIGNVLPSASRSVLAAGPDVTALRDAAARALID